MERILVAMDPEQIQNFAGIHALNLAKRISAKVFFLLVLPLPPRSGAQLNESDSEMAARSRVEGLIREARADGISVDYYTAYGDYEREMVNFVQENKVTLLVIESQAGPNDSTEAYKEFLENLRHRINCRIEVVNEKAKNPERKE